MNISDILYLCNVDYLFHFSKFKLLLIFFRNAIPLCRRFLRIRMWLWPVQKVLESPIAAILVTDSLPKHVERIYTFQSCRILYQIILLLTHNISSCTNLFRAALYQCTAKPNDASIFEEQRFGIALFFAEKLTYKI